MGCQQIAAFGGLDLMASVIIKHFPMFDNSNSNGQTKDNKHLKDHELDLLVAILGLLVNLVEKNSRNRCLIFFNFELGLLGFSNKFGCF